MIVYIMILEDDAMTCHSDAHHLVVGECLMIWACESEALTPQALVSSMVGISSTPSSSV